MHIYTDPEGTEEDKSFVNNTNSVGPKADPCGIPVDTDNKSDFTPFSTVTQRFFQFYRLILRSAFSLIMNKKNCKFLIKK